MCGWRTEVGHWGQESRLHLPLLLPVPSASQFTKIRGGSDTRPPHQEPTVLWWTETGSQGKSLLQRAIFHKKKKSN